jgi:hypothetical protein
MLSLWHAVVTLPKWLLFFFFFLLGVFDWPLCLALPVVAVAVAAAVVAAVAAAVAAVHLLFVFSM